MINEKIYMYDMKREALRALWLTNKNWDSGKRHLEMTSLIGQGK